MSNPFGEMLKRLRTEKRVTLRDYCLSNGIDPGNYSRIERGLFPPPQKTELIERYATALGVARGSDEWLELFDLAAASRGEIPQDLMDNDGSFRSCLSCSALFEVPLWQANPNAVAYRSISSVFCGGGNRPRSIRL